MRMQKINRSFWALWGIAMLLIMSSLAPLRLAQDVHNSLSASSLHHAQLHLQGIDANASAKLRAVAAAFAPLSGQQHSQHHNGQFSNASPFELVNIESNITVAPSHWQTVAIDYALLATPFHYAGVEVRISGRAPPHNQLLVSSPCLALHLGRAPPVHI